MKRVISNMGPLLFVGDFFVADAFSSSESLLLELIALVAFGVVTLDLAGTAGT